MEQWPRQKSPEELNAQIKESEEVLGADLELPHLTKKLTLNEIKEQYPDRYQIYLQILRANRSGNEIEEEELKGMREWIQALNNLDAYIEGHKINEKERILRSRQFTIFEDIRSSLEKGILDGYVKVPTGVGKTVLFSQILEAIKLKALIAVPSKILIHQTGEKLDEFTDVEFGKYFQDIKDLSKDATIITYKSLLLAMERGEIDIEDFPVLILDEVHKGMGKSTAKAIKKFQNIKLGFTATPKYSAKKHVESLLKHRIHEMTIVEAVREGLISRFKSVFAFTATDISKVPVARNGDYDQIALEAAINTEARNLSAVQLYKEMFAGQSAIAYCGGVAHAENLAALFNEKGVTAAVISGRTKDKQTLLKKFKSGEIAVLCNAKLLIEGFDEPRASVALNVHPTLSEIDAEQRAGRVLRLDENNPEKWGYIVDFIDRNSTKDGITFPEIAHASEMQYLSPPENFNGTAKKRILEEIINLPVLPRPNIEGLRVMVNTQEILSISKQHSEDRIELSEAPAGWLNANQIARSHNMNHQLVQKLANVYRPLRTDWFQDYKTARGTFEHYHPDLVKKIIEDYEPLKNSPEAPAGWVTLKTLARLAGSSANTIENELAPYKDTDKKWFNIYKTSGRLFDHFHPELAQKIIQKFKDNKPMPGWQSASQLRDILHVSDLTIKKFVETKRKDHDEWFESKQVQGGRDTEYYHPDLVALITKEYGNQVTEKAPKGWMTPSQLVTIYSFSYESIFKIANKQKAIHSGWVKDYKTRTKVTAHYHPDLVAIIIKECERRKDLPPAPKGWLTAYALALELKRDTVMMKALALPYRKSNPGWFKEFKTGKQIAEFYHPDLVAKIREDFYRKK